MAAQKQTTFKYVSYTLGRNYPQTRDQARVQCLAHFTEDHIGNVQNWTAESVQFLIQL